MSTQRKRAERSTDKWKFYQDGDTWRWKYIMQGKTVAQAYSRFEQYEDCIDDARSHGYRGKPKGAKRG